MDPTFGSRYKIVWKREDNLIVAEVRNYSENVPGYRRIPIRLDDTLLERISMRLLCISWGQKGPEIVVSSEFLEFPASLIEAGIWHEVGHVHHEHDLKDLSGSQDVLRERRLRYIRRKLVMPEEAEVDHFAVDRVGKAAVISFLERVLRTRPKGDAGTWNELGRSELRLRISEVRKLASYAGTLAGAG